MEFVASKVAILLGPSSTTINNINTEGPQLAGKFKVALIPARDGGESATVCSTAPICLLKTSKNPEAAKLWVEYFCSPEQQKIACGEWNRISAHKEVMNYLASSNEMLAVYADQFSKSRNKPIDLPIVEFSQVDAWPDGPMPMLTTSVIAGKNIDAAIADAIASIRRITGDKYF
jgi:multiple sugar transport system substrate-binding protein